MAIKNLGKSFPTKSGKSTKVILSFKEIKELYDRQMKEEGAKEREEKYGKQVYFFVSGSASDQYGHGLFTFDDEPEKEEPKAKNEVDESDLPF